MSVRPQLIAVHKDKSDCARESIPCIPDHTACTTAEALFSHRSDSVKHEDESRPSLLKPRVRNSEQAAKIENALTEM